MEIKKASQIRKDIIDSCAWMLWANAWIDYNENLESDDPTRMHPPAGGSWDPLVPAVPNEVKLGALKLIEVIERLNHKDIAQLYADAANLSEAEHSDDNTPSPTPERYGECLAYHAIGAGASWMDDHPDPNQFWPEMSVDYFGGDDINVGGVDERFV